MKDGFVSCGSALRRTALGKNESRFTDEDGKTIETLPARGLHGPVVFATVSLALKIVPDESKRAEWGPEPGHNVEGRRAETKINLDPIRKLIADEVAVLLDAMRHRGDFSIVLSLGVDKPPTTVWWREMQEPSA